MLNSHLFTVFPRRQTRDFVIVCRVCVCVFFLSVRVQKHKRSQCAKWPFFYLSPKETEDLVGLYAFFSRRNKVVQCAK